MPIDLRKSFLGSFDLTIESVCPTTYLIKFNLTFPKPTSKLFRRFSSSVVLYLLLGGLFISLSSVAFSKEKHDNETSGVNDPMTLILDRDRRVIYSVGYNLPNAEHGRLYWTIDENILTSTNYYTAAPSVQCPPLNPSCTDPRLEFSFDVSRYCDGEAHRLTALSTNVAAGGSSVQRAFLQGGLLICNGGGSSLPQPTELPVVFVPGIMGSVMKGAYQGETVHYWPNFNFTYDPAATSARNLTLNTTSPYYRTGLYPTDAIRSVLSKPFYEPLLTDLAAPQRGFNRI